MKENSFLHRVFFIMIIILYGLLLPNNSYSQPKNWVHFFQEGDLNDPMGNIVADDSAVVWALKLFDDKKLYKININEGFDCQTNLMPFMLVQQSYIQFVISNDDDCIYLFSSDSICKIDKNNASNKTVVLKLSEPKQFASAYEVQGTGIYVTCNDGSVYLFKNNTFDLIGKPIDSTTVYVQFMDSQKRLWFKAGIKGLFFYKNNSWTIFNTTNSSLQSNVFSTCGCSIFETADKKIVAASCDSGLLVFDGTIWKPLTPALSTKTEKEIRCCARDSSGAIWIGTNAGILRLYNNQWYFYTVNDYYTFHAPRYNSYDVVVDKKNRVWFSMLHDGVFMLDQTATPNQCNVFKKLKITSPVKSGAFTAGVIDSIVWNSYGNIDSISLCYKTAIDAEWIDIFPLKRNIVSSSRRWIVPSVTSNDCYLRIRDWEDSTVEDITGPFSIVAQGTNVPPSFNSLPDSITIKANETTTLTIHATDPESDTVKFTYANLPSWASVNDSVITFKPVEVSINFTFTITLSDGKGGSVTDSVRVIIDQLSIGKSLTGKFTMQPFEINKTISLLTITTAEKSTMHSAALYTLSGKCAGIFSQHGSTFTLDRKSVAINNRIFVAKVNLDGLHGSKRTISRLLLWQ